MNSRSPKFTNASLIFAYLLKRSGHEMIKAFASVLVRSKGTFDCECFYLVQYNVIMILNIICARVCVCLCVLLFLVLWKEIQEYKKKVATKPNITMYLLPNFLKTVKWLEIYI